MPRSPTTFNAPATGEAMADLILNGRSAIDLTPFDPARLPPLAADELALERR